MTLAALRETYWISHGSNGGQPVRLEWIIDDNPWTPKDCLPAGKSGDSNITFKKNAGSFIDSVKINSNQRRSESMVRFELPFFNMAETFRKNRQILYHMLYPNSILFMLYQCHGYSTS